MSHSLRHAISLTIVAAILIASGAAVRAAEVTYPAPSVLFSDPTEVGDVDVWRRVETAGDGTVTVSTEVRHGGRYAVRCAMPVAAGARRARVLGQFTWHRDYAKAKAFCLRAYVRLGDDLKVGPDDVCGVLAFGSYKAPPDGDYEGHMAEVAVRQGDGGLVLCVPGAGQGAKGKTVLTPGAWHCVEADLVPTGEGKARMAVLLDGKEELKVAEVKLPHNPDGLAAGLLDSESATVGGSLYVDDVVVAAAPVGTEDVAVRLAHPSFVPRVGAPVVALLTGDRADDRLVATLESKAGLKRKVFEAAGPFEGRADFRVDLAGLPASDYTLTVSLLDASGKPRAAAAYSYTKPYDGDTEYSIDASNAIVHNGRKFFPVTSFGLKRSKIAEWKENRYCNMIYGMEWAQDPPGVPGYKRYLDAVAEAGMVCAGPAHDYRFDRPNKPQWTPDAVKEYLAELGNHPGVAWWLWREEPINWKYDAASQKEWYDLVKRHDPKHMTEILHMGGSYQIGILRAKLLYETWPHMTGDVYSWDIYPIENEHEKRGTFVDYAQVADRSVNWNMGLVPVIVNVAPADCTLGKKGGTPTPEEIAFVCWLSIVHRAKGVHWYPYQGKVPPENYAAMTKFVDDTTALADAVLGDDSPIEVRGRVRGNGRIDVRATTDGQGNVYVFAVNLGREGETMTFTLGRRADGKPLPEGIQAEVYGENRTIVLDGATFTDDFAPIGVHVYKLPGAAK